MVTEIDISSFNNNNEHIDYILALRETKADAREFYYLLLFMCVRDKIQYLSLNAGEEDNVTEMVGGVRYSFIPLNEYYMGHMFHFFSTIVHESTTKWVTPQRHYARFDIIQHNKRSCGYISEDPNGGNIDLIFFSHT